VTNSPAYYATELLITTVIFSRYGLSSEEEHAKRFMRQGLK